MADFSIRHAGGLYVYKLDPSCFTFIERKNTRLPLTPLEDWYLLYQLMPGREARVSQIEAHLRSHGANAAAIGRLVAGSIPDKVRQRLLSLENIKPTD